MLKKNGCIFLEGQKKEFHDSEYGGLADKSVS